MESVEIVKVHIFGNAASKVADTLIIVDVDFVVFERSEEPFNSDIVNRSAFAVHGDSYTVIPEYFRMFMACVLTSLIGVENLGCTICVDGFFEHIGCEKGIHRVGEFPGEN